MLNKLIEFIVDILVKIAETIDKHIKIFKILAIIFCISPIVITIIERFIK